MAAPSIPNLLSLRGGPNRRGRGRAPDRGGGHGRPASSQAADVTVQGTDTDAAISRLSAVELGYLEDPFAQYFVASAPGPSTRRLPIINRGTYTRTTALDRLVESFISGPGTCQVVSLGAGTDTRAFRLISSQKAGRGPVTYHEVDFPAISSRKLRTVKANPLLARTLPSAKPVDGDGESWESEAPDRFQFWCHGLDLRQLAEPSTASLSGLRHDVPTLLISECCLCYLEEPQSRAVIKWFADRIPSLAIVLYEPTRPDDAFGKMMVSNLAARSIRMPTLAEYRAPEDQETRLKSAGFDRARQMTVDAIWEQWVTETEKDRVDGIEGLDEVEEWKLLASHYVVAWGWKGQGFDAWETW